MKLFLLLSLLPFFSQAQTLVNGRPFPQQEVNETLQKAWEEKDNPMPVSQSRGKTGNSSPLGINYLLQQRELAAKGQSAIPRSGGILYVGATPNDTLIVTGAWQNNGDVAVVNDGVLIFDNAQATIAGDLVVSDAGQIIATNSTFYFPQQYFYEWSLQAVNYGLMHMKHCTLNFAGLAHGIGASDSATISFQNIYFTEAATTGLNDQSTFTVDTSNTLGEIVAGDSIHLTIKNADTVLIWHRVNSGQGLTWIFPDGVNIQHYGIGPDSAGVTGLQYTVELDSIKLAQWALMPENGSNVNVSNSTIRSVGVLFGGTDSATVQGLVDKSNYTTSPVFFTDRTFELTNCSVETWGIYPGDTSQVNITSCITGEIGSGGMARTNCSSSYSDGTGGYFWANSTAYASASNCGLSCPVRAEQGGIVIVGFCSIAAATGYAIDSGLLIMIQTPTISPPVAYDGSDIWVGMLTPQSVDSGDVAVITGSAYILRGPTSQLMSFESYYVAYQAPDSSNFTIIDSASTIPVTANTLVTWSTAGLALGQYPMILVIKDNQGDSVIVNSEMSIVAAAPQGIASVQSNEVKVFPNPATNELTISAQQAVKEVKLEDMLGRTVLDNNCVDAGTNSTLNIDITNLPAGIYIYSITTEDVQVAEGKVVKL